MAVILAKTFWDKRHTRESALCSVFVNSRGSFMLSTLIFIGLIMALLTTAWRVVYRRQDGLLQAKIQAARPTVLTAAIRNVRVATYYYATLIFNDPINADFKKCMIGDDGLGNDCIAVDASGTPVVHQVRLVDQTNTPIIGHCDTAAVYYDFYGQPCAAGSDECPFKVYADYIAECDGGASSCAQAYTIRTTVYVGVDNTIVDVASVMASLKGSQQVAISNFFDFYNPILPPNTPWGPAIVIGAGPGGFITTHVLATTTTTLPTGSTTTTSSTTSTTLPPPPPTMPIHPCPAGENVTPSGVCKKFKF